MTCVFLSASIPLPHRDPRYFNTADNVAIRDSIRALINAVVPSGRIIFGGHPAITPLIRLLVLGAKRSVREHIVLYQSRFFENQMPPEAAEFEEIRLVDAVANNREASLTKMREEMIGGNPFDAAIFIGGMEGVEAEYEIFRRLHPHSPAYPIASTGAAALGLYKRHAADRRELMDDLRYLSLFRRILELPTR
jgi:hypothetical protein